MKSSEVIPELSIVTIGRDPDNTVVLADPSISRNHARLMVCSPNSFIFEDCGSKKGIFFEDAQRNKVQVTRKLVDIGDTVWLADSKFLVKDLRPENPEKSSRKEAARNYPLDFTTEFSALQQVYDDYPELRKACRNREKMIRLWSVVGGSIIGVGTVATAGTMGFLAMLSSAGLSILIPTLASHLLSTEEKLELLEKEYRQRYRCPNPDCRDPFGNREYEMLVRQKTCGRCKAVWVK
ncbi:FHA domain-containing protein [Salmonirosea aquatica]|uniref:FHA domain-containing protein n=1 Tax=Salmonirosea aquatica TaxID=2654236 RepID=A0A7C9BFD5_9BACT|nr:FHA domain-containing protein [Cytophagaceae bacterium SJW1-29]